MAGNLITADYQNNKVRQHSGFTTTISQSFAKTGAYWAYYDAVNNTVYFSADVNVSARSVKKGTGFTGTVASSFNGPAVEDVYDIDFDESGNVLLVQNAAKCYKMSGFSSTVSTSYTIATATNLRGVTYDGTNAINQNSGTLKMYKLTGFTSTVSSSFTTNAGNNGVTWDGTNLYSSNTAGTRYKLHSGFSSTITSSCAWETGKTASTGMDWDGYPAAPASNNPSIESDIIFFN